MLFPADHTKISDLTCGELEALIEASVVAAVQQCLPQAPDSDFLGSKACAELIGVTPEHLCAMRARGEGPPWSGTGKWVRYSKSKAIAWLEALPPLRAETTKVITEYVEEPP